MGLGMGLWHVDFYHSLLRRHDIIKIDLLTVFICQKMSGRSPKIISNFVLRCLDTVQIEVTLILRRVIGETWMNA